MTNAYFNADDKPYSSMALYMREYFGQRVQKISVNAGFSCPNRDGQIGYGGCSYCNNEAFTPSYCIETKSITQQVIEGIEFHRRRYRRAEKYLVYFQSYSNTYASAETLKTLWAEALSVKNVIGLVISTRPDCLDEEKMKLLASLSKKEFIQLEIGIESLYDSSLKRINRGHDVDCIKKAFENASQYGIRTGGHIILGLPGETRNDTLQMASQISELPVFSLKIHQLQIVKGSLMEKEFEAKPEEFDLFSLKEYCEFVVSFCEKLRPDIRIERFASEVPPRFLVAPNWGIIRYDQVMGLIEKQFSIQNTWQGKLYTNA